MLLYSITGNPGSNHFAVADQLSARLDLNFYSAKQFGNGWAKANKVEYYTVKSHKSKEADDYIDSHIQQVSEFDWKSNLCIDSFHARQLQGFTAIFIEHALLDNPPLAAASYEESRKEVALCDEDMFNPGYYDMSFPDIYLKSGDIVKFIVDASVKGKTTLHIRHPYQCLPLLLFDPPASLPDEARPVVFDVIKYGYAYYVTRPTQYADYLYYLEHRIPMEVRFVDREITYSNLCPADAYGWLWQRLPSKAAKRLETCHRLSRYIAHFEASNVNIVYLDLSKNANPLRVLTDEGF